MEVQEYGLQEVDMKGGVVVDTVVVEELAEVVVVAGIVDLYAMVDNALE